MLNKKLFGIAQNKYTETSPNLVQLLKLSSVSFILGSCTSFRVSRVVSGIGSQSAPHGAPGLRERNLGARRAIRLLIKILTWLILQLSKEA